MTWPDMTLYVYIYIYNHTHISMMCNSNPRHRKQQGSHSPQHVQHQPWFSFKNHVMTHINRTLSLLVDSINPYNHIYIYKYIYNVQANTNSINPDLSRSIICSVRMLYSAWWPIFGNASHSDCVDPQCTLVKIYTDGWKPMKYTFIFQLFWGSAGYQALYSLPQFYII
jgi:hypothetical protein